MAREDVTAALSEVLDLVAPDGAGLDLVSVDEAGSSVVLQLDLGNVECLECVLPRDYLERLALSVFQQTRPEVQQVSILDPREQN